MDKQISGKAVDKAVVDMRTTVSIERYVFPKDRDDHDDLSPYHRLESTEGSINVRADYHKANGVSFLYIRVPPEQEATSISISDATIVDSSLINSLGWVFKVRNEGKYYLLWIPVAPAQTRIDQHERISPTIDAEYLLTLQQQITLMLRPATGNRDIVFPVFVSDKNVDSLYAEFASLGDIELRRYVKSEWFLANNPGDLWRYLINGSIFDPRSDKQIGMRFKCQQCAYAWWSYFDYLHKQTGKEVWKVLRDEIAFCAVNDMDASGAWRNGFWSDDMEIHARFHLDGLHMLVSQYERTGDRTWFDIARRGMSFVERELVDIIDGGSVWFLHDDLHASNRHKIRSKAFGKNVNNSLCLNTHIQALTVLHRLSVHCDTSNNESEVMLQKGLDALEQVLASQPADALYRFFVPRLLALSNGETRSTREMLRRRYKKRLLSKFYWKLRARYPRFVQPNGFIERDLTVEMASYRYHVTNVKDLLTLYLQRPLPWLEGYIKEGFGFLIDYLDDVGIGQAIENSSYFIEVAEILSMYNKAVEPVGQKTLSATLAGILERTGGYSLDYCASDLVDA
jgi:hypothetical protein